MNFLTRKLEGVIFVAASSLLFFGACTDDGGSESASSEDSSSDTDGDGDSESSAEGNESTMGDGEPGDGDGDPGDGDGDPGDGDGDPGKCEPMDAEGVGPCDAIIGVTWNGEACVELSGCECEGQDCEKLFEDLDGCMEVFGECVEGDGCAGLDEKPCEDAEGCMPIIGQPLEQRDTGWCALERTYLGCSSQQGCDDAISFACPDDSEGVYQTPDSCIPDVGWVSCQAPTDAGAYDECP